MTAGEYLDEIESNLGIEKKHCSILGRIKDIAEREGIDTEGRLVTDILHELGDFDDTNLMSEMLELVIEATSGQKIITRTEVCTMPNPLGTGKFLLDGSYLYGISGKRITKYDVTDLTNPVQKKYINTSEQILSGYSNTFKNAEIVNGYLYVVSRTSQANVPDRTKTNGRLYIVDLATFTMVKTIDFDRKPSDLIHYNDGTKDYLFINMQMCGWCIYEITTDPLTPTLVYDYNVAGSGNNEFQRGGFYTDGTHQYYVAYGFADGIRVYNIDTVSNPVLIKHIIKADVGKKNGGHFYSGIVMFPYMYATYGNDPDKLATLTEDDNEAGIIVINISDLNNITYKNALIPYEYAVRERSSDTQPVSIYVRGNQMFCDNYINGLECFNIREDGSLKYYGNFPAKNSYATKNSVDTMFDVGSITYVSDGSLRDADGKSMSMSTYGQWHIYI